MVTPRYEYLSTVEVRVGSFADGSPRLQTYNWNTCKVAHLRPDSKEASRPKLGRPSLLTPQTPEPTVPDLKMADTPSVSSNKNKQNEKPAKIQTRGPTQSIKEPIITREMFDKWTPDLLGIPSTTPRPVRSTRNPNPQYIDAVNNHLSSISI